MLRFSASGLSGDVSVVSLSFATLQCASVGVAVGNTDPADGDGDAVRADSDAKG